MDHNNSSNSTYISAGEQVATAICGLSFLLGISGNITVVVFLLRHFKMEKFTLKLMLNLAASDILCLLPLPVWMYSIFLDWTMGLAFCRFISFVSYTGINASAFTITLMSVHRYVLVLHTFTWNKLGQRQESGILMSVWVLAGVIATPSVIMRGIIEDKGKLQCVQVVRSEGEKIAVLLPEIMLVYLIPLTILMTSYLCLQRKVNERAQTNHKLAPLVTAIVVTFFMFTTPFAVVCFMIMATPSQSDLSVRMLSYRGPRLATQSITLLNSCVNPLLYAFNLRALHQSSDKNVREPSNNI